MKIKLICEVPVSKDLGLVKGKVLEAHDKNGDYETSVKIKGKKIDVIIFNSEAKVIEE